MQQRKEHRAIALVDLARFEGLTRLEQLAAGCDQPCHRFARNVSLAEPKGAQESDVAGPEAIAFVDDGRALFYIFAAQPNILPRFDRVKTEDTGRIVWSGTRILLHNDSVGPLWEGRTGKDAKAGSGLDGGARRRSGRDRAGVFKCFWFVAGGIGNVRSANREPVHGGAVKQRQI